MFDDDTVAGRVPPPLQPAAAAAAAEDRGQAGADAAAEGEGQEPAAANGGVGLANGGEVAGSGSEGEEEDALEEQAEGEEEGEEGEEEGGAAGREGGGEEERGVTSVTLAGLVRRMVRLADDKSYARQLQRGTALRFVAAVASRLGAERVLPYLPALMRPLYRITEPGEKGA